MKIKLDKEVRVISGDGFWWLQNVVRFPKGEAVCDTAPEMPLHPTICGGVVLVNTVAIAYRPGPCGRIETWHAQYSSRGWVHKGQPHYLGV